MAGKLHKTRGIVLRAVKYGETSLVVTVFTELFGLQSYIVSGVRTSSKTGAARANHFQPSALLDLVVYHNEQHALHRIREFRWAHIYQHVLTDVRKNAVAVFMVELLTRCLKQPESNPDLYYFSEDIFLQLDESAENVAANLPLFFALHLSHFFGFRLDDNYSKENKWLDLREGSFVNHQPVHPHFLENNGAALTSQLLKVMRPSELADIPLNQPMRRELLGAYEDFYRLHVPDFGRMKTIPVLKAIIGG
jgi:DNA repair protein RecO (recombination protein O)